jgi:hypothetical protein
MLLLLLLLLLGPMLLLLAGHPVPQQAVHLQGGGAGSGT